MIHADGHRCNNKSRYRLNCFPHCDRAAMKETLSPCGQVRHKFSPEGLDVDRLGCSISQTVKRYLIRFYLRSSVFIL